MTVPVIAPTGMNAILDRDLTAIREVLCGGVGLDNFNLRVISGQTSATADSEKMFAHSMGSAPSGCIPLIGDVYIQEINSQYIDVRSTKASVNFYVAVIGGAPVVENQYGSLGREVSTGSTSVATVGGDDYLDTLGQIEINNTTTTITNSGGDVVNVGIYLSSGRLSVTSADGTDFSSSNVGQVTLPSSTPGLRVTLSATTPTHYFDCATAADSDIIGEEFGTTAGVAWGYSRPFYLYAVNVSSVLYFAISPNPCLAASPASGNNIGYQDNVAATPGDSNMFFLTSTAATSFTSKPCKLIGSFRMTKNSSDDWTVTTLDGRDGIGEFQENRMFQMPLGQMGANSGQLVSASGGSTACAFTSSTMYYKLTLDGMVETSYYCSGDAGTDGSGGGYFYLHIPYVASSTNVTYLLHNIAYAFTNPGVQEAYHLYAYGFPGYPQISFQRQTGFSTYTLVNTNLFAGGDRLLHGSFRCSVFSS